MKTKEKTKFYWHIHHDILLEPLTELLKNRIAYIKQEKPKEEQALRLKLLKPVKGKLPQVLIKVGQKYVDAGQKWNKAGQKWDKIKQKYYNAMQKYYKAGQRWGNAEQKYYEVLEKYKLQIEKLHKKECPNCHWNGKTIFPKS